MKFRIEIELIDPDGARPWEWRVWSSEDGDFDESSKIAGSKKTAADALDEAVMTVGLSLPKGEAS